MTQIRIRDLAICRQKLRPPHCIFFAKQRLRGNRNRTSDPLDGAKVKHLLAVAAVLACSSAMSPFFVFLAALAITSGVKAASLEVGVPESREIRSAT